MGRRLPSLLWLALLGCGAAPVHPPEAPGIPGAPTPAATLPLPTDDSPDPSPNVVRPLGALVGDGGVTFAVWAPHAAAAWVEGDFNGWSDTALDAEDGGNFAGFVAAAQVGQDYRFRLEDPDGGVLLREDPHALAISPTSGHARVVNPAGFSWTSTFQPPPYSQQVVYELHLGTFNDPTGTGSGTWQTAAEKLDYLQALGINMVEVMPVAQFPGAYSWGYNPTFPFAPENHYGTADDARAFVDAAHQRGIGVILDVVHNHWGGGHLPMWCFDGPCFGAGNGGIYFYTNGRRDTGFGPRPDYGRAQIRDYIAGNATMWLTDYRMDGLRWDSTVNIREAAGQPLADGWALLQRVTQAAHAVAPGSIQIAEDLQGDARISSGVPGGGAGFDSQWDPAFYYPVKNALISGSDASRSMAQVAQALSHSFNGAASQRVIYTEDHDMVARQNGADKGRLPALISPATPGDYWARKRSTLGATLVFTAPGIPMLFMGQEFLEDLTFPFSAGQAIDWTKPTTYAGICLLYQRLIGLRRDLGGTTAGLQGDGIRVYHVNDIAKVVAYHRWKHGGPGDDVVVVANFSNRSFTHYVVGFPVAGTWHVRFNGDSTDYASDFQNTPSADVVTQAQARDGLPVIGSVALGPYSAVVLSQ